MCGLWLHPELLPAGCGVMNTVGRRQQPAVAQHGSSTRVTRSFDVKADLPGPLPLPGHLTAHNAGAPVWPHTALWKKKEAAMKTQNNCARRKRVRVRTTYGNFPHQSRPRSLARRRSPGSAY